MQVRKIGSVLLVAFLVAVNLLFCSDASISMSNYPTSTSNLTSDEWSLSTRIEIDNVSVLFDDLTESLSKILDSLSQSNVKSRVIRDTFSETFGEATLCEISLDELSSLRQLLINIHNNSMTIAIVNIPENINICSRMILEIKNIIIGLKNNFNCLRNMQDSAQNFATKKQNYESKILELQRKVDNLRRSSNQASKTQIDQFSETIHRLKSESQEVLRNLENERRVHRDTKIKLCIEKIKIGEEYSECVDLFKSESYNETMIRNIISEAYANNVQRIFPILDLSKALPHYVTRVCVFETLLDKIFRNGHQNSPSIIEVHYCIDSVMKYSNFHAVTNDIKLRYENVKTRSQSTFETIINTWVNFIRSGSLESIIKFEFAHLDAFLTVAEPLMKKCYSSTLVHADKCIDFLQKSHPVSCYTKMISHLFNLMNDINKIVSPQGMRIAAHIKFIINHASFSSYSNDIKTQLTDLKNNFPCGIHTLYWTDAPTVKSMSHNEYLYPASNEHKFGDRRRRVLTWRPGDDVWGSNWKFETNDEKYFTMYNTYYNEYLYAANDELAHDGDRRVVLTWIGNTDINDKFLWEIIPRDADTFYIRNKHFSEYLYSADYQPYDRDRRRVFTWRPRTLVGNWKIGNC